MIETLIKRPLQLLEREPGIRLWTSPRDLPWNFSKQLTVFRFHSPLPLEE